MNLALHATREVDATVTQSEQRVVLATTDVFAGMELRAALTNDDLARLDLLTGEHLHAQSFCVGIAAVTGRTETFLMCHVIPSLQLSDGLDFNARKLLAMAAQLLVVLALLELEHQLLGALELLNDLGGDLLGGSLAGSASTTSPSTKQITGSSTVAPTSASSFSMFSLSPTATLYCLPPVFTIAYMFSPTFEINARR